MVAVEGPTVLAVDQGTSATKAVLVDLRGAIVSSGSAPLTQSHPKAGWAEQDPIAIWESVKTAVEGCLDGQDTASVAAVGLSTQRESTVLWERATGKPVGPMLGWQDARGSDLCDELRAAGHEPKVRELSGLPLDAMWSSSKATWLLDEYDPQRKQSRRGQLCLGTVDSWLVACLGGRHVIEAGNASRTQLLDLRQRAWDPWLLKLFHIPEAALPAIVPSTGPFTSAAGLGSLSDDIQVTGVLGDSHAALFAHGGWRPGQVKATYGTGSSVMGLTDQTEIGSPGLCRSIAWEVEQPAFALEGNIRSSGATVAWLARLLGITVEQVAATAAPSSEGVHLVPAFTGLGAPWWDDRAVGLVEGLRFETGREHLARAALEAIAFQIEDVVGEVEREVGAVEQILADGGPTSNATLMQLQADTSGRQVQRALDRDLSALGAAHIAGLSASVWTWDDLARLPRARQIFNPTDEPEVQARRIAAWRDALAKARSRPAEPEEGSVK